jgi:hypothetical protein
VVPGIDRESLLNSLLMCDETGSPDPQTGVGGPVYWYAHAAEDGGFIRHPGLPGGNLSLRTEDDVRWLMDQGYIQARRWGDDKRSFTFELTDRARDLRSGDV